MAKREKQPHGGVLQFWQKGESGNPKGRPRSALHQIEKAAEVEFGVTLSKSDKLTIIESLLEMNFQQIQKILSDKNCPAFVVIAAKAIAQDVKDGAMGNTNSILDRIYGKANQPTDITTGGKSLVSDIDYSKLSDNALAELARAKINVSDAK